MSDFTYELIKENEYLPAFFRTVEDFSITVPAHWHQYLEIIYLTAGKMTAVIQGQTYELTARDMLIINSEDIHMTQISDEETCYYLLQVSASQLSNFFPNFQLLRFDTIISPVSSSDNFTTNAFKEFPLSKAEHCMIEMHSIFQKKQMDILCFFLLSFTSFSMNFIKTILPGCRHVNMTAISNRFLKS